MLILTDYCLTPHKRIVKSGILCEKDKIIAVGGASAFVREPDIDIIELENAYAVPGFIDSHIHGAGGFDSSNPDEAGRSLQDMGNVLAAHGVTTFVPTVVSARIDKMLTNLSKLADMIDSHAEGVEPVGIHVEGPFINKVKHGTQFEEDLVQKVDLGLLKDIIDAGKGKVKKITFAPELEGAIKLIEFLKEHNIQPSMGHSIAREADVLRAIDAGARNCTHLFNGMPVLHQRDIALTAVALTDERVTIELILDGKHLHPRMIDLSCRCKPKDKVIGISDSNQGTGMNDGNYHIGPSLIHIENGVATTDDGALAGSTMLLDSGWHSLMTYSHMMDIDAAACTTFNPAVNLGLEDRGQLLPGKRADIAIFESETSKSLITVAGGRIIYDATGKHD